MPQSLSNVIVHIIFSTKDRYPFLHSGEIRLEMHRMLGGISRDLDCKPLIVGGVADHVHILARQARTITLADWIKELKRQSTLWVRSRSPDHGDFHWQAGYGAFSIGRSQVEEVRHYIQKQEEHHRKSTFQDEFRRFLEKYEMEYDERFVWD